MTDRLQKKIKKWQYDIKTMIYGYSTDANGYVIMSENRRVEKNCVSWPFWAVPGAVDDKKCTKKRSKAVPPGTLEGR